MGRFFRCLGRETAIAMKLAAYCRPVGNEAFFFSAKGGSRTLSAPDRQALHFEERSHSRSLRAASVAGACASGSYVLEMSFAEYSERSKATFGIRR